MIALIFLAGLAAWIGTSTIVEAEIFRDVRESCDKVHNRFNNWWTYKLRYLIHCHMCTGIWVAALIALFIPPLVAVPVVGWGLTALAIKGVAHSFLVLQKLGEAITSHQNSQSDSVKWEQEQREQWEKEQNERWKNLRVPNADSPSDNSHC